MAAKRNIAPYIVLGIGVAAALTVAGIYAFRKRKKKVTCNSRFLFIGDSNVANPGSYANLLKSFCPDSTVVINGKVGAKTDYILAQLQSELSRNQFDVITILGGSNDIYALGSTTKTKENLIQMYKLAKDSGATVVAVSPPNKDYYPSRTEQKQALLYDLVKWIPRQKDVDVFINLHAITKDPNNLASDNQHMSAKGKLALITEWSKKVLLNGRG